MATSRDWEELTWAWREWRSQTGKKMKSNYTDFVELLNKAARLNGKCVWSIGYTRSRTHKTLKKSKLSVSESIYYRLDAASKF